MRFDRIIRSGRSGVYAAPPLTGPLRAAAARAGLRWFDLDLAGVADRDAFLQRCEAAFSFPGYYGRNWDALHECLRDIADRGEPGAIVHWRRGAELAWRAPEAVTTALEVLKDVAAHWGGSSRTFLVVVDRDSEVADAWRLGGPFEGLPSSFFIDERGVIQERFFGQLSEDFLAERLESILPEAAG